MTFTAEQQQEHREAFIKDCRQRAWAAACRTEWIGKQLDKLVEDCAELKAEDEKLEGEIETLETAVDYHTVENRAKCKALQERRNLPWDVRPGKPTLANVQADSSRRPTMI
jgi:predicted RNase H-like nuclease (RuvC/YqgF family)